MRAQLICSIVGHIWHAVWLNLLLVVFDLSIFVCSVKHQVSKTWSFCKYSMCLSNNNPGFSLWGLTINSLTRIDEDISDIFWAAGIFLCVDQLLPGQPPLFWISWSKIVWLWLISTKPAFDFNVIFLNVITSSGSYDHNNYLLWWLMFFLYCVSIVCSLVSIILDGEALGSQYLNIIQISRLCALYRIVTPVWIHWWLWNNAQRLI